jgi:hypothetical protein
METELDPAAPADPELERAMFLMDLELAELTAVIPQGEAPEPKSIY